MPNDHDDARQRDARLDPARVNVRLHARIRQLAAENKALRAALTNETRLAAALALLAGKEPK